MVIDGVSVGYYNNTSPDPTDDDYFPLMDRMGNVTGYKKAQTTIPASQLDAVYDYDAFGQEVRSTGPAADVVPYHFSTKFTDATGLVYYGYRWYDAQKGRWLSRDPIGSRRAKPWSTGIHCCSTPLPMAGRAWRKVLNSILASPTLAGSPNTNTDKPALSVASRGAA
jgi:RHS repeat-associated protein